MGPRRIVGKIRDGALAVAAYSVHDLELNVLGQHGADRVEVVRVEALHIGGEPFSLSGVERRLWRLAGVGCERAQALPPSLQRRFDRGEVAVDDLGGFCSE